MKLLVTSFVLAAVFAMGLGQAQATGYDENNTIYGRMVFESPSLNVGVYPVFLDPDALFLPEYITLTLTPCSSDFTHPALIITDMLTVPLMPDPIYIPAPEYTTPPTYYYSEGAFSYDVQGPSVPVTLVPEPGSIALLGGGMLGFATYYGKRRKRE